MGKTQSKSVGLYRKRDYTEGDCFVVNAHFSPLGIDDSEETLLKTKSAGTSEITLSTNSCQSGDRAGFADDKYPLKVVLPPETGGGVESQLKDNSKWDPPSYVDSICQDEDKTTKNNGKMKSNGIQGFECDVSVEADFSGKQKREFVFTLYDLDGDGQITKDDITGLVRSMYEALGSSLKLPPSGSRTIRVRLTMSPGKKATDKNIGEKKKSTECHNCGGVDNCADKEPKESNEVEKNTNNEEKDVKEQGNANDGDDDDDEEEGETDEEDFLTTPQKNYLLSNCLRKTPPHRSKRREMNTALNRTTGHRSKPHRSTQGHRSVSPCVRRRTRVSFSKEQQLLEIIQSNLEKKKNCGQCPGQAQRRRSSNPEGTPRQHHVRKSKSNHLQCECVVNNCQNHGRIIESCSNQSKCVKGENGFHCHKSRHHQQQHTRSHSHDLTDSCQHQQTEDNLNHLRVEDILLKDVRAVHEKIDWFGNFISQKKNSGVHQHTRSKSLDTGFGYLSSHHHKHRHREEDHQRAMEQVACWIEKEHSGLRGSCIPPSQQQSAHHNHIHQEQNVENDTKKPYSVPMVERHEHHHIHQHYHHHYHHYHQL